jgi:hypothetical protein
MSDFLEKCVSIAGAIPGTHVERTDGGFDLVVGAFRWEARLEEDWLRLRAPLLRLAPETAAASLTALRLREVAGQGEAERFGIDRPEEELMLELLQRNLRLRFVFFALHEGVVSLRADMAEDLFSTETFAAFCKLAVEALRGIAAELDLRGPP